MRGVISWAVAGGATSSANTSSAPVIWAVSATASPSSSRKPMPSARVGTPRARATPSSTEANSSGRPKIASSASASAATSASASTCPRGDAEEAPEQQALVVGEHALVEAQEEEAAGEPERLHGARDRGLLAEVAPRLGRGHADDERREPGEDEVPGGGREADQQGAGGAGKGHHRQGVSGERLPAQHHEPADDAGHDRDDRAGLQRVDHERVRGQLVEVRDRVQRRTRFGEGASDGHAGRCDAPGLRAGRPRRACRRRSAGLPRARRRGG